jgi:polysaccharide biosynthesis/export protein
MQETFSLEVTPEMIGSLKGDQTFPSSRKGPGSLHQNSPLYNPLDDALENRGSDEKKEDLSLNKTKNLPSALENYYSQRADTFLRQFGYNQFLSKKSAKNFIGVVNQDYTLGIGDILVITLRGQQNENFRVTVDREGKIILPDFNPISVVGLTVIDVTRILEKKAKEKYIKNEVYLSLEKLRAISVYVSGEVNFPGKIEITNLSSVLDALIEAHGVKKTGTLRHIQLIRNGSVKYIDLYGVFLGINANIDEILQDNDKIIVPPVQNVVAISDNAKRPGIYELFNEHITPQDIFTFSGGTVRPAGNRFIVIHQENSGTDHIQEYNNIAKAVIKPNDVIRILPSYDNKTGGVYLEGQVRVPGIRSYSSHPTVRSLIGGVESFGLEPYTLFGVISTTDPLTYSQNFKSVNLARILEGKEDYKLHQGDSLIILGKEHINFLTSKEVQQVLAGKQSPSFDESKLANPEEKGKLDSNQYQDISNKQGGLVKGDSLGDILANQEKVSNHSCKGLDELAFIVSGERLGRFAAAVFSTTDWEKGSVSKQMQCPDLYNKHPKLLPFILDHVVAVRGEVNRPGVYPITKSGNLHSLLALAGYLSREADRSNIEVTRFIWDQKSKRAYTERHLRTFGESSQITVFPGDGIRVGAIQTDRDDGPVLLAGEFKKPGWYDIRRGEKILDIIQRAGGVSEYAYPYGSIFTRESIKNVEKEGQKRLSHELELGLASNLLTRKEGAERSAEVLKMLLDDIKQQKTLGRVVIEADPAILAIKPEVNILLEPFDRFYMPKKASQVTIMGEVLNPSTLQFRSGLTIKDYIRSAGGFQRGADERRIFVVLPNGEAKPMHTSFWSYKDLHIPPGSTVVVPKDISPFNFLTFARDVTPVLSNLAVSAASLSVIQRQR